MRFAYFIACFSTALDAADLATGLRSGLFGDGYLWIYWILAALWLAIGIYAFVWRPQ